MTGNLAPGQRVRTPQGIGRVVCVFPARRKPVMETVTVRFRKSVFAIPFYTREVSLA